MQMLKAAAAILTIVLAAACGDQTPTPRVAPQSASGGAGASTPTTGPAAERQAVPASPTGTKSADAKPDPGDANDHSSPQHDAKKKKNGD